ncbi:MAG: PucR family transcriptional regulator ligand-binding domain-containing protein, partial [Acidimicrobiales bacterium]
MRVGISVEEALDLPSLAGTQIVAGRSGLPGRITSVNMMEVPDIGPFLAAGELLVTTGFPLRGDDRALARLIPMLASKGLSALAIKQGRYVRVSTAMIDSADRLGLPVLALPAAASFNEILSDVLGTIMGRQALRLERSVTIHDRLTAVVLAGGSFPELIRALSDLIGCPAALFDAGGQMLASFPELAGEPVATGSSRPIQVGSTRHG